jgi:hypothetical protein
MSIEREVTTIHKDGTTSVGPVTEEMVKETREQRKARVASLLDRGVVIDRLIVNLPPEYHGEWVAKDDISIMRWKALGFWVDGTDGHPQFSTARALHSDGTTLPMIGDTIFMVTTRENKELIDEVRREQYERTHGKPGEVAVSQREEKSFKRAVADAGLPTPVIEESKASPVGKAEIEAILGAKES